MFSELGELEPKPKPKLGLTKNKPKTSQALFGLGSACI